MTRRTAVQCSYADFLAFEYAGTSDAVIAARTAEIQEREDRLAAFPHSVVLQVAYPELDFANRWCWHRFGPAHGECHQASSEYAACDLRTSHAHVGSWLSHWLVKTDYDFGFNEWCFAQPEGRDRFLDFVPQINWGEGWPA
jgi:hypothetical protein